MAVTKVLNIGDCGSGYHGKHLRAAIDYIKDSEKTDGGRLVGGCLLYTSDAADE